MTAPSSSDMDIAFPHLSAAQIDTLRPRGEVRSVTAGEVLWKEGDRAYGFFVALSGSIEIIERSHGEERLVIVHEPGQFTGDVDMITGRVALITGDAQHDSLHLARGWHELAHRELPIDSENTFA